MLFSDLLELVIFEMMIFSVMTNDSSVDIILAIQIYIFESSNVRFLMIAIPHLGIGRFVESPRSDIQAQFRTKCFYYTAYKSVYLQRRE